MLKLAELGLRRSRDKVFAIGNSQGFFCSTRTDSLFLFRVKIVPLARVDCYNKAGVSGDVGNISFNLADICPTAILTCNIFIPSIAPVRKLNNYKWQIFCTIHKFVTPQINHLKQHILVLSRSAGIRFTLIPQGTGNCMLKTWSQHRIVKCSRKPLKEHLRRTITKLNIHLHLPFTAQINSLPIKRVQGFCMFFKISAGTWSNKCIISKQIIWLFLKES